jgi:hypothetical protein
MPCRPRGRAEVQLCSCITSAQDGLGGQCHAPVPLLPRKIPLTHCTADLMKPKTDLDVCREVKVSCSHRFLTRNVLPIASSYTNIDIPD